MSNKYKDTGKGCLVVLIPFILGILACTGIYYLIQNYCS